MGLLFSFEGNGFAYQQNIEPGIRVPGGTEIKVKFKDD